MTKPKKNITVQDIAKAINISASTVSRALNNNPKISQKTKEKVWKSAKQMGYLPNIPVYMQKKNNNIVIFLVDTVKNFENHEVIKSAQEHLLKKGYLPMIQLITDSVEINEKLLNIDVVGVISLLNQNKLSEKKHQEIINHKLPLVIVNKSNSEIPYANVLPDIYNGAYLAVTHLLKRGAKNIALIRGNIDNSFHNDLQNGFNVAANPISNSVIKISVGELNPKTIKHEFNQLINRNIPFDGIITYSNYIAQLLFEFLNSNNISIPDEVMLISFGNETSNYIRPPRISSVEYSSTNMGLIAAQKIEKAILDEPLENRLSVEPVKLIIRSSSMRI